MHNWLLKATPLDSRRRRGRQRFIVCSAVKVDFDHSQWFYVLEPESFTPQLGCEQGFVIIGKVVMFGEACI